MTINNHIYAVVIGLLVIIFGSDIANAEDIKKLIPPLNERDFSKIIECPNNIKPLECYKYKKMYSTINCPFGKATYAGMGETDSIFQVWCGNNFKGKYIKRITCPNNSHVIAGVGSMSNIWELKCINQKSEFNGPFYEWYSSGGKFQSVLSGHYRNFKPVGYFFREDLDGMVIEIGEFEYEENSINFANPAGEWLRWDYDKKKWKRTYHKRGLEYRH